jgi:A/G-specific adenine glycosylase
VCLPGQPDCAACPLGAVCRARACRQQSELPMLRLRKPVRAVREYALVMRQNGQVWLEQRHDGQLMAGLWTFPRFASRQALRQALPTGSLTALGVVTHSVLNRRITVRAFQAGVSSSRFRVSAATRARWFPVRHLSRLALPAADRRLAASLGTKEVGTGR